MAGQVAEALRRGGAAISEELYAGCAASHIVCEPQRAAALFCHGLHMVSPAWALQSVEQQTLQRVLFVSPDMARHLNQQQQAPGGTFTRQRQGAPARLLLGEGQRGGNGSGNCQELSHAERQAVVKEAKAAVRKRRAHSAKPGAGVGAAASLPRKSTPPLLLENVCWAVTDPPHTAQLYCEAPPPPRPTAACVPFPGHHDDDASDHPGGESGAHTPAAARSVAAMDAEGGAAPLAAETPVRPITDEELARAVLKHPFVTILFPRDRLGEAGSVARTFYSPAGYTLLQLLEHIHSHYQDELTPEEVGIALYTDSKQADKCRAAYVADSLCDGMRRCDLIGSRRHLEALQRVGRGGAGHTYELLLEA